uniref:Uncharacterized protein n=1 Tax=Arundo donax TaxID=35708 RepID=A0A0A9E647_ARUDO
MADALELYRCTSPAMHPHTDRQFSGESAATAYSCTTPPQQGVPGAGSGDAAAPCLTKPPQSASSDVTVPQSSDEEEEETKYDGLPAATAAAQHERATPTAGDESGGKR